MLTPQISPNVVIMTREELKAIETAAFRRGVERGRFEEGMDRARAEKIPRPLDNGASSERPSIATESEPGSAAASSIQPS